MILNRVTITGADDSIDPSQLAELSLEFPFVEWGILVSGHRQGINRFPSGRWLGLLLRENSNCTMNLSAHVCGYMVRDLICAGQFTFKESFDDLYKAVARIQLNTHGAYHAPCLDFEIVMGRCVGHHFIFQYDGANEKWINEMLEKHCNSEPLFDISHGAGVLPNKWPSPIHRYCGYAGGLGPDNLESQIEKIAKAAGDSEIWIDCETRVRSNGDALFDVSKVRRFLKIAKPYVSSI